MKCRGTCGRELVPKLRWTKTPRVVRNLGTHAQADARGLCVTCLRRAQKAGTIIDFERVTMPRETVLEEWARLADRRVSKAENVRRLAPRLGMTPAALDRAVNRATKAGLLDWRPAA